MDSRRVVVNCREFAFRITRQHVVERQRKDVCVPIGCGARGSQVRRVTLGFTTRNLADCIALPAVSFAGDGIRLAEERSRSVHLAHEDIPGATVLRLRLP